MTPVQPNPDISLALAGATATLFTLPVISWVLLRQRNRRQAGLWFAGIAAYATAAATLAVAGWIHALPYTLIVTALPLLSVLLPAEALRREAGLKPRPVLAYLLILPLYVAWLTLLKASAGLLPTQIFHVTLITAVEVYIVVLLRRLVGTYASPGLRLCMAGMGAMAAGNLYRVIDGLTTGVIPTFTDLSASSNVLFVLFSLGVTVAGLGYWGFLLERSEADRLAIGEQAARAQEGRRVAEAFNDRLQAVIHERDQMIMANSRFSTLGKMAILNAGIVHEVSQPLQGLLSCVETLELEARTGSSAPSAERLAHARELALEAAQTLQALRRLGQASPPSVGWIPVQPLLDRLLPVIESESRQRGVRFTFAQDLPHPPVRVRGNSILLHRILLNLVANALEAMTRPGAEALTRELVLHCSIPATEGQQAPRLRLAVTDSGPGLGQAAADLTQGMAASDKPEGMGIGLLWVRLLVEQWGGDFQLTDRPAAEGRGALARLHLPLGGA